jgi:hypothetical protein
VLAILEPGVPVVIVRGDIAVVAGDAVGYDNRLGEQLLAASCITASPALTLLATII